MYSIKSTTPCFFWPVEAVYGYEDPPLSYTVCTFVVFAHDPSLLIMILYLFASLPHSLSL